MFETRFWFLKLLLYNLLIPVTHVFVLFIKHIIKNKSRRAIYSVKIIEYLNPGIFLSSSYPNHKKRNKMLRNKWTIHVPLIMPHTIYCSTRRKTPQCTDKLYHIMLYRVHLAISGIQPRPSLHVFNHDHPYMYSGRVKQYVKSIDVGI